MAVVQVDAQLSIPEPFGLAGRYYWTWVCYFDVASPTSFNGTIDSLMENSCRTHVSHEVRYDGYITTYPPRSGNRVVNRLGQNLAGTRTDGERVAITNVMRMTLWSGEKAVGYRLWRAGFQRGDYTGSQWTSTILGLVRGVALVPIASGFNCSLHGEVLTNVTIDSALHMANLRHGTKRRARKVLT